MQVAAVTNPLSVHLPHVLLPIEPPLEEKLECASGGPINEEQ